MKALFVVLMLLPTAAMAALVDPALQGFARAQRGQAKVLVLMDFQPRRALPIRADGRAVRRYLFEETKIAWGQAQRSMQESLGRGDIRVTTVHSINQSFTAFVTPAGVRALANQPGITKIYADGPVTIMPPVRRQQVGRRRPGLENMPYDIAIMGLDQVYQQNPGLSGTGVLVGHIDTGVDGKHPALAGKIAAFYNAGEGKPSEPFDDGEHGTHTAGTIVGNPKDGLPMGVAPGARLVAAAGLNGYEAMLKAMEFMLDPDGKPETSDMPKLVSNSWNCERAPDLEAFYRAINAWEAAGIFTIFSAGNAGPRPRTITKPHEHPNSFSIGAFGPGGKIADFSSRGPGVFQGKDTMKPDISAPGVDIVSATPGGRYEAMSGTSMAAPHVAGLAALLYQIAPTIPTQKMREILIQSSNYVDDRGQDLPQARWNPTFGFGRVNALKAVNMVKGFRGGQERRWSNMMAPAVDIVRGFSAATGLEAPRPAVELIQPYVTDTNRWIDGRDLL